MLKLLLQNVLEGGGGGRGGEQNLVTCSSVQSYNRCCCEVYCEDKLNIKTELHVTELAWGPYSRNIGRVLFLRAYEPDEPQATLYT